MLQCCNKVSLLENDVFTAEDIKVGEAFCAMAALSFVTSRANSSNNASNVVEFYGTSDRAPPPTNVPKARAEVNGVTLPERSLRDGRCGEDTTRGERHEPVDTKYVPTRRSSLHVFQFIDNGKDEDAERDVAIEYDRTALAEDAEVLEDWNLDPFAFEKHELEGFAIKFFRAFRLCERFDVSDATLTAFMGAVAAGYHDNPFHNWRHAFKVRTGNFAATFGIILCSAASGRPVAASGARRS